MRRSLSSTQHAAGRPGAGILISFGTAAIAAVSLLTGVCFRSSAAGQVRNTDPGGWKQYRDAHNHISLSIPTGWTVRVDDRHILVTSADHAAFAVIENFVPQNGETAEDHVDALPKSDAAIFARCKISDAYTLDAPVKTQGSNGSEGTTGEQAIGTLTYVGEKGPGQARVLSLVFPNGGLIFGLAATNDRFATERPSLLRILQSFQYYAPAGSTPESTANGKSGTNPTSTGHDSLADIHYTSWSDTQDHAFSVEVPKGWTTDGGTFRASPLEIRQMVLVRSPHEEMAIMLGDASVPGLFTLPSQNMLMQGHPEGSVWQLPNNMSSLVLHYMPAAEFNHWYLTNLLSKYVSDLEIQDDTDNPEAGAKMTEGSNKMLPPGSAAHYVVTVAETRFTCVSKATGRPMAGILNSFSSCFLGDAKGGGNWNAHPNIFVWATGDSQTEARQAAAKAVHAHMQQTWKMNAAWMAAETAKQKQFIADYNAAHKPAARPSPATIQASQNAAAQSRVMTRNTVQAGDDRRAKMMGDFRARMAAKDDMTRKQQNYSLDQTDVSDGSRSWKVASGYSNYYRHEATGTIVGTNDPTHPGVGFTQLGER